MFTSCQQDITNRKHFGASCQVGERGLSSLLFCDLFRIVNGAHRLSEVSEICSWPF